MWQRWNQSSHIFEKSDDNGGSWTPLPLSGSIVTEGTIPNVAYLNRTNTFTIAQNITAANVDNALNIQGTAPGIHLVDTAASTDQKRFRIINQSSLLILGALNDAGTAVITPTLALNRFGDIAVARGIFELGRTTALGFWTIQDCSSYSVLGHTGPFGWARVGKTLYLNINARSTIGAGNATSRFNYPGGFTPSMTVTNPVSVYAVASGLIWETGIFSTNINGTFFDIYRQGNATFPAGDTLIYFSIAIPIN